MVRRTHNQAVRTLAPRLLLPWPNFPRAHSLIVNEKSSICELVKTVRCQEGKSETSQEATVLLKPPKRRPIELAKVIHNLRAENSSYLQEFSTAKKVRSVQQRREETAGQTHV